MKKITTALKPPLDTYHLKEKTEGLTFVPSLILRHMVGIVTVSSCTLLHYIMYISVLSELQDQYSHTLSVSKHH